MAALGAQKNMIVDCNAFLGHYPFRRLVASKPNALLENMDRFGIDRAIVSWLPSVFYRDAHSGNEEFIEALKPYRDRFVPIATLNPRYVGWESSLHRCVEMQMQAVALVPSHHGFQLTEDVSLAAIQQIERLGLPLVLTQRFEDRRQRHAWDVAEDLEIKSVIEIAQKFPKLKIMLCNWNALDGGKLAGVGLRGRCLIDFSRLHVILNRDVPKLIDTMGVESIVFGSHAPFDYIGPSLVKLSNLEYLPKEQFEAIAWRNATSFFNL